jgi:GWxTD domain-containing protein
MQPFTSASSSSSGRLPGRLAGRNIFALPIIAVPLLAFAGFLGSCRPGGGPDIGNQTAAYLARGDTAAAFDLLRKTERHSSGDPDLAVLLAGMYRRLGTIDGRLKAQEVLENAYRLHPDEAGIILELGITHYEQTFYPDAERCFRQALKTPLTTGEAHFRLARDCFRKWKRNQHFLDDLKLAAEHFKAAGRYGRLPPERAIEEAVCDYCREDFRHCGDICRGIIDQDTSLAEPCFLLGVMAFQRGEAEDAATYLEQALQKLPADERECYQDIALLLSAREREEYESADRVKQLQYRRLFWFALDPDPTTPLNERYLEHLGRVFLADVYFSTDHPHLRGWENERGKSLIKFGWPEHIERTLANLTGRSYDGWAEIWSYGEPLDHLELVFVDEFLNGTFAVPRDIVFSPMARVLVNSPAVSSFETEVVPIPGRLDAVSFKNSSLSSSVYVLARIDADSLLDALGTDRADCLVRGVCFDTRWNETDRFLDSVTVGGGERRGGADRRWFYYFKHIQLPFDVYQVSWALFDQSVSARGIYNGTISTQRYLSDSLSISDILLYQPAPNGAGWPELERGGRRFMPSPEAVIGPSEKLNIYFELYNLARYNSFSEYEASYFIYDYPEEEAPSLWTWFYRGITWLLGVETDPRPDVVQTAIRKNPDPLVGESMTINIDALEPGRYLLKVRVLDRYNGARTEGAAVFSRGQGG